MGAPGSGKSTYAQALQKKLSAEWIVLDDFFKRDETGKRFWMDGDTKYYWDEKFTDKQFVEGMAYLWRRLIKALQSGVDIIVESPFHSYGSRIGVVQAAKSFNYEAHLLWVDIPLSEVLNRNKSRIDFIPEDKVAAHYLRTQAPIAEEGWDVINRISGV
jgi:predicted kinase